ncbi:cytochrome c oxidase, partial [Coemansia sp. RSA 2531]
PYAGYTNTVTGRGRLRGFALFAPLSPAHSIQLNVVLTPFCFLTVTSFHTVAPKSRTLTKEWQEDSNRIAREKNINPIHGISSEGYKGKGFVQSN